MSCKGKPVVCSVFEKIFLCEQCPPVLQVILRIFHYLSQRDLLIAVQVSLRWRRLAMDRAVSCTCCAAWMCGDMVGVCGLVGCCVALVVCWETLLPSGFERLSFVVARDRYGLPRYPLAPRWTSHAFLLRARVGGKHCMRCALWKAWSLAPQRGILLARSVAVARGWCCW